MKKKFTEKTKGILIFVVLLGMSVVADLSREEVIQDGIVTRNEIGREDEIYLLQIEVEDVIEGYEYNLEVSPVLPTREEAEAYFEEAISIIERNFAERTDAIPVREAYIDEKVKAKWTFLPFGIIDSEGRIQVELLEKEPTIIRAQVELSCGEYEKIYEFPFKLTPPELTEEEKIIQKIENSIQQQMLQEGNTQITLPKMMDGKDIEWSEEKKYITPQVLLLEVVAGVLFYFVKQRKKKEDEQKRCKEMEEDYPDIVNQLSLLLGAGMTTRQAWARITAQYGFKRKQNMIRKKSVYEALVRMNRRLIEGESERIAYQQFLEEISMPCYRKLMRLLLANLEKGTQGISIRLEEESRLAFEQKIMRVKKRGEEASTKMLVPLVFMLMIVMGMVMVPAFMEFKI